MFNIKRNKVDKTERNVEKLTENFKIQKESWREEKN